MQVQREAQHSSHGHSFEHFLKGVHSAAGVHAAQADSGSGGGWGGNYGASSGGGDVGGDGDGQGSPLKYEMNGGGGEMLPQMREG